MSHPNASNWISPWWQLTPDVRRFPPLAGDARTDIAVIGGGIVGALTAWQCARRGAKVILIERHHVGTGDTGFSTAFLLHVPDAPFDAVRRRLGDTSFATLLAAARAAQDELRSLIASHGSTGDWSDAPALFGSYTQGDRTLRNQWNALAGVDPTAQWISGLAAKPFAEAIRFPHEASMNPRAFLVALLTRPNPLLRVVENTEVTRLVPGQPATLETPTGTITADKVIVATGSLDALVPDLAPFLTPMISYVLTATYPGAAPIADGLYWDTDAPYQYYRRFDRQTIMVGGADRTVRDHGTGQDDPHAPLQRFLDRRFPGYARIDRRWSGTLFETSDGLPLVGQHPAHPSVFVATGFSGNGMVMGAVASRWLAAATTNHPDPLAAVCSPSRDGIKKTAPVTTTAGSPVQQPPRRFLVGLLAMLTAAAALAIPTVIFFAGHRARGLWQAQTLPEIGQRLFPLLGLYAFTLVWIQILLGSLTPRWRTYFPRITKLHRWVGIFALVFAVLHPLLLLVGVGPTAYLAQTYVAPELVPFLWVGYVQLLLLLTTGGTALLMKLPWLRTRWRVIHWLNYLIFFLVLVHSWALGHDVRTSITLQGLWIFYGGTVAAVFVLRLRRVRRRQGEVRPTSDGTVDLGPLERFPHHQAVPIQLGTTTIAIFRNDNKLWAIANACSHAGGPLCEGAFEGTTVVCPWHGSRFDLTSGAVLRGPATRSQSVWSVSVKNGRVILSDNASARLRK